MTDEGELANFFLLNLNSSRLKLLSIPVNTVTDVSLTSFAEHTCSCFPFRRQYHVAPSDAKNNTCIPNRVHFYKAHVSRLAS